MTPRRLSFRAIAILLLWSAAPTHAQPDTSDDPYRNPIVFALPHYDADTGAITPRPKTWIMEEDGSRQQHLR